LTAVIAAPWFAEVAIRQPDFLDFYLVGEHFRRFFQAGYSHGQPIYYYVPVIIAGTLPWSLFAIFVPWCSLTPAPARRFCLIGAATILIVFSIASAKLIPYILPAIPLIAIVIASGLFGFTRDDRDETGTASAGHDCRRLAACGPLLGIIGAGVLLVAIFADRFASPNAATVQTALYAAGAIVLVAGGACFAAFWGRRLTLGLATVAAAASATLIIASYGRIMAEPLRSYARLARTIAERAPAARLICYPRYIQSLPFYSRRRVILVGPKTELAYGAEHSPDAAQYFFNSRTDLMRLWSAPTPTVLIVDRAAFPALADSLGSFTVIAEDPKKIAAERVPPGSAERTHAGG
jgi:4-amino-4-deoxy-L-arabinose transferase-like glycosyltransferase